MKRSTEPIVQPTTPASPQTAQAAGAASQLIRFYIDSWEIHGGAPRPVVGRLVEGYRVVFRPSQPENGMADLDEDVDVDALPAEVVVPAEAHGGVRRGHLHAEWHVTPSEGPLYDAESLSGLVVRTQVIALDRRLGVVEGLGPAGEAMEVWSAIPGTLHLREVTDAGWDFDEHPMRTAPSPAALGAVRRGVEEAVLVDLQVPRRPLG